MTRDSLDPGFHAFASKMQAEGLSQVAIDNFHRHFQQLLKGHAGLIPEADISPVESLVDARSMDEAYANAGKASLPATVMIKLNGGLGTSMGLEAAKSLVTVKDNLSFLDIIIRHAMKLNTRLLFMNSFSTRDDTLKVIADSDMPPAGSLPRDFLQHKVPRIDCDTMQPATCHDRPQLEWCPPGHGDIYIALLSSGVLDRLLEQDIHYAMISNSDNLGASLDEKLLGYLVEEKLPFLMEVTDRTEADKKGGHLAQARDGSLLLRESAQCPKEDRQHFENIKRHRYFNTNNLWINLRVLKDYLDSHDSIIDLPLICNRKNIDPGDPTSKAVYQLETAMGSAISVFPGAAAVRVPRTRFAPVKTTSDLLLLQSDLYELTEEYSVASTLDPSELPPVSLDSRYYRLIQDFQSRFACGAPSLEQCTGLTIEGDVSFGKNIKLLGKVHLRNSSDRQIKIDDDSVLEGEHDWS